MRNLKKGLFILAFFAVAISASAQFQWGIKAGFNASTITGLSYESNEVNYRPGFHAGLMGQYMFGSNLGLETGLYYSMMGVNVKSKDGKEKSELNPSYLQLPISLLYKIHVGQNLSLNPSLGVYMGYGIGGKGKFTYNGQSEESDFFGKEDGEEWANRFDMGATAGLTLQFEKVLIGLGYDYGFMRINKEKATDGDKNLYNGNVKVSVGYLF